ncbi:MAG: aminoacyl-tRNA hydrolase [Actinobacteria bacterium RBG_16_64_13]|nr:MAG: aminoacyl-tRNA hydrolase [Actinobacteria bacterium RBG_16_64_13]
MHLVVALGNPGPEYQFHRHNAGFMVGEELRRRHGLPGLRSKYHGLAAEGSMSGTRVLLLLPMTFMNLSGRAAAEAARKHGIPVERMLVIHDEVELPFGEVRLKEGQGLGGHNGLRSLAQSLGSRDFWRLRVGVGRPDQAGNPLLDYVLAPFSEPRDDVLLLIGRAADLADEWLAARGGACRA